MGSSVERGNLLYDVKRKSISAEHEMRNINAYSRGGSSRISDEDAVMVLERRGCGNLYKPMANR